MHIPYFLWSYTAFQYDKTLASNYSIKILYRWCKNTHENIFSNAFKDIKHVKKIYFNRVIIGQRLFLTKLNSRATEWILMHVKIIEFHICSHIRVSQSNDDEYNSTYVKRYPSSRACQIRYMSNAKLIQSMDTAYTTRNSLFAVCPIV